MSQTKLRVGILKIYIIEQTGEKEAKRRVYVNRKSDALYFDGAFALSVFTTSGKYVIVAQYFKQSVFPTNIK